MVEILPRTRSLLSLAGLIEPKLRGVSVDDMDAGIASSVDAEFGGATP